MLSTSIDRLTLWRDLLVEQGASGLSIKDWCAKEGVSTFTYYYWRKRVSSPPPPAAASVDDCPSTVPLQPGPEWLPVSLVPRTNVERFPVAAERTHLDPTFETVAVTRPTSSAALITLRIGVIGVEVGAGFDPRLLGDVLSVLEARC